MPETPPVPQYSTQEGPTLHAIVERDRIGDHVERVQKNMRYGLDELSFTMSGEIDRAMAAAYREGLRDGFQQGALAESKSAAARAGFTATDPDAPTVLTEEIFDANQ